MGKGLKNSAKSEWERKNLILCGKSGIINT